MTPHLEAFYHEKILSVITKYYTVNESELVFFICLRIEQQNPRQGTFDDWLTRKSSVKIHQNKMYDKAEEVAPKRRQSDS